MKHGDRDGGIVDLTVSGVLYCCQEVHSLQQLTFLVYCSMVMRVVQEEVVMCSQDEIFVDSLESEKKLLLYKAT